MNKLAVIALGGNALLRDSEEGTIGQQEKNTYETLESMVFLLKQNYNLIITHGNGPQIGNILLRNDAGEQVYTIPQMPLDVCVADSQGGIGYMIERVLKNILREHGIHRNVLTLMTMVEVDPDDPAFSDPRKPIGKSLTREQADLLSKEKGWTFKEENKTGSKGYRRVVPSPFPEYITNWEIIAKNACEGTIVIALGGGGVPVYKDHEGNLRSAEAVIDKDIASAILATQVGAREFYILTDVSFVYENFRQSNQKALEFLNYKDTLDHLEKGTFGEGNMLPKIKAALSFIENGGEKSIITESKKLEDKSYGTKISMDYIEEDLHKYD